MEIIWTAEAVATYFDSLDFILEKWSINVAEDFEAEVLHVLNLLSSKTKIFSESKQKGFHKAVISKQTSLVYQVTAKQIILVAFIDNLSDNKY